MGQFSSLCDKLRSFLLQGEVKKKEYSIVTQQEKKNSVTLCETNRSPKKDPTVSSRQEERRKGERKLETMKKVKDSNEEPYGQEGHQAVRNVGK